MKCQDLEIIPKFYNMCIKGMGVNNIDKLNEHIKYYTDASHVYSIYKINGSLECDQTTFIDTIKFKIDTEFPKIYYPKEELVLIENSKYIQDKIYGIITYPSEYCILILIYTYYNKNLNTYIEKLDKNKNILSYIGYLQYRIHDREDFILANISHEIRTPLNGIVGYTQLLLNTDLNITQKTYVNSIYRCSLQLVQIINDILDFSKLKSGRLSIDYKCCHIREIIDSVEGTLSASIKNKRQDYTCNIDNNFPEYIYVDKSRIIQILVNIVSNANKYTDIGGKIFLNIQMIGNDIEFTIKDTGIGIDNNLLTKIFDPFYQVRDSHSKIEGTGLGLTITNLLTRLMNGTITVKSVKNKGSEFIIKIPHKNIEKIDDNEIRKELYNLLDKYVLVVDDNIENRIILMEQLISWNLKPVLCSSAFEALKYIESGVYSFAFALIDILMPEISGRELAAQLRHTHPNLPLVALSSLEDIINGFDAVLYKPINLVQLYDVILNIDNTFKELLSLPHHGNSPNTYDINILVAEDVDYNRELMSTMLLSLGYTNITLAIDGADAIKKIKENHFDILLLDLKMPNIDGFGVMKYISTNSIDIIVVAITASVMDKDKEKCNMYNIKYFLDKPIDLNKLRKTISTITSYKV